MSIRMSDEGFTRFIKVARKFGEANGLDMMIPYRDPTGSVDWGNILSMLKLLNTHLQLAYQEIDQLRAPPPVKTTTQIITGP